MKARLNLRTQLIFWNIIALTVLLALLGVTARYTVGRLLIESVHRRLEAEVHSAPPPFHGPGGPGGPRGMGGPFGPGMAYRPMQPGDHDGPDPRDMMSPPYSPGSTRFGPSDSDMMPPGMPAPRALRIGPSNPYDVRHFDMATGKAFGDRPILDSDALQKVRTGGAGPLYSRVYIDGEPVEVLTDPYIDHGQILAVVQAGYPMTEIERALAGLDTAFLLLIPVGLAFAGGGGALLTSRVLQRVRHTAEAAEQIEVSVTGGISARLPVVGSDEFAALAGTFNDLLGRLEGAFRQQSQLLEQQRRFTADASHELKTPLTVIRGTASLMQDADVSPEDYRRSFGKIDRAAETMSHLVQDLLLLARSDSGQLGRDRIELLVRDLIGQAVAGVSRRQGAPIQVALDDESLTVLGSEIELVRVFTNLLDNALRHTPETGVIRVTVERSGGLLRVVIADTGAGISPEHLPHIIERFYRVDTARSRSDGGTGLGLAICKSIVEAHGGSLEISSTVGAGTTVEVRLPPGER